MQIGLLYVQILTLTKYAENTKKHVAVNPDQS